MQLMGTGLVAMGLAFLFEKEQAKGEKFSTIRFFVYLVMFWPILFFYAYEIIKTINA